MKARLLLIDDDASVRESLARALRLEGYEVNTAADGQEALALFLEGNINLILLDLNMPGMNGWETFERMNTRDTLVPVIIITARPHQSELATRTGAAALVEKPIALPMLIELLDSLLHEPAHQRMERITNRRTLLFPADSEGRESLPTQ